MSSRSTMSLMRHATMPSTRSRAGHEEGPLLRESKTSPLPSESQSIQRRSNIVLFGETGAGKSSLVNLILGEDRARTSPNARACTLDAKPYDVTIKGQDFCIYDTVGLNEPEVLEDPDCLVNAINKAYRLIQSLADTGGVHLLLFCIRRGRITASMQQNYKLFHDFLCQKKVPIALVITHLEQEESMEEWWTWNERHIMDYGIRAVGHACTTTQRRFEERYHASRQAVHDLLLTHVFEEGFTQEKVSWVAELFQKLLDLVGLHPRYNSVKVRSQKLREYGLKDEEIQALLLKITSVDEDRASARSPSRPRPRVRRGRRSNTYV